jgi:Fe-S-cluster-containing hydrogenase component 2
MVEIRSLDGAPLVDTATHRPIVKATKCDLCSALPAGPSCERACPHGALRRVDIQSLISEAAALGY